jgi:spore maturation protein CgeB
MTAKRRILVYNSRLPNNNIHLALALCRAFNSLPNVEAALAHPQTLGLWMRTLKPHAVVAFGGEEINEKTLPSLEALKKQSEAAWVMWTTEDPFELEATKPIASFFDVVLTTDKGSLPAYEGHPHCYHLPLAADTDIHYRTVIEDPNKLRYDLLFVGTAWPNRVGFLGDLVETMRERKLRARFLAPTNPHIPQAGLDRLGAPFERDVRVSPKDLATLQNQSLFALTLFRDFSGKSNVPRPQTSPTNRFFETALAGTGQVVASESVIIGDHYPNLGNQVIQTMDLTSILEAIEEAHQNHTGRNRAAQALQQFIMDGHLYKHRAISLLEYLDLN